MRKSRIISILLIVLALTIVSCENEKAETGSLRIYFGDETKRSIVPDELYTDTLDYYEIELLMPNGDIYKASNITQSTLDIKNLPLGDYQLSVFGYKNGEEGIKAKGKSSFHLYASENSVTVPLSYIGKGSLNLKFSYDKTKLPDKKNPGFSMTFQDEEGNEKKLKADSQSMGNGLVEFTFNSVDSGVYIVKAFLVNNTTKAPISAIVETIRIVPGKTTTGVREFYLANTADNVSVAISPLGDNEPIAGTITESSEGSSTKLTATISKKPDYIDAEDISYKWIINGEEKANTEGLAKNEYIIQSDDIILDKVSATVIVSCKIEGLIASITKNISVNNDFIQANPGINFEKQ